MKKNCTDYQELLETIKDYVNDVISFEELISISNLVKCENCGQYVFQEQISDDSIVQHESVCENCLKEGYGC